MSQKNKQKKAPTDERKPDTGKNSDNLEEIIERQREQEKNLYPVRVSKTTVIYVTKKKVTKEYAEEYNRDKLMRLDRDGKEKEHIDQESVY